MSRILMDPSPDAGGGGTAPAQPAAPAPPVTTAIEPAPAPAPSPARGVVIEPEEYKALLELRSKLAEIEGLKAREIEAKEQARLRALAEKGEADRALAEQRATYEARIKAAEDKTLAIESALLNRERDAVVATAISRAMAGKTFVSAAAAAQAQRDLMGDVEVTRDAGGNPVVREKGSHRPAAEMIAERLASDDYKHFIAPSTQGGAGAKGGDRAAPAAATQTQSLSDSLIESHRAKVAAQRRDYHGLSPNSN